MFCRRQQATDLSEFCVSSCQRRRQCGTRRPVQSTSLCGPRPVSRHLDLFADENCFSTAAGGCPARRCIGKAPDRSIDVRRVGPIALHHTRPPERRQTDDDSNGRHFLLIDGRRRGSRTLKKIEV